MQVDVADVMLRAWKASMNNNTVELAKLKKKVNQALVVLEEPVLPVTDNNKVELVQLENQVNKVLVVYEIFNAGLPENIILTR